MKSLSEICELVVDCEHKTAPTQEHGYPSIRTPNIGKGYFILNGVNRVSEETYKLWTRRATPQEGDLILAREAPVGNVAVIPEGEQYCLGQRTVLIRPKKDIIDPNYLCFLLLSPGVQGELLGKSSGATVHHLNIKDIRALQLPNIPSLNKQKQISSNIKKYDTLIATNQKRINLLEEAARLIYREWFVHMRFPGHDSIDKNNETPEGWTKKPLREIAKLHYGKALKASERKPGKFPVYGSSGIVGYHNTPFVQAGSIIVGRKGNIGSLFYSEKACFPIDTVFFISPEQSSRWLYFALHSLNFISSDSAVPGLNRGYAESLPVMEPDMRTQERFKALTDPLFTEIEILQQQNHHLAQARDLLLPKLMSGQIDVSNIQLPDEDVVT